MEAPDFKRLTPKRIEKIARNANVGQLSDAAYALSDAFLWTETPEGQDFWEAIYSRLMEMYHAVEDQQESD